jgi:hypothetical protein
MKEANLTGLVKSFLDQGLSVCYLDKDDFRRAMIRKLDSSVDELGVGSGELTGYASMHYNVVVAVNSHEWSLAAQNEWPAIAGYRDDKRPVTIRVST